MSDRVEELRAFEALLATTAGKRLVEELRGDATIAIAERLGGYDLAECGRIVWSSEQA